MKKRLRPGALFFIAGNFSCCVRPASRRGLHAIAPLERTQGKRSGLHEKSDFLFPGKNSGSNERVERGCKNAAYIFYVQKK